MKKKLIVAAAAVLLVALCMPFAAMAASPKAEDSTADAVYSSFPAGTTLSISAVPGNTLAAFQSYATANGLGTVAVAQNITLTDANNAVVQPDGNTLIYVSCPVLHADGEVAVLHMSADGSIDRIPNVSVGEGHFVFHPTSMSPFGYIVIQQGSTPGGGTATTATSPRTGVYA